MLEVAERSELAAESLVCEDACLGKSPNRPPHFEVDVSIECQCLHIILLLGPNRKKGEWHSHVFEIVQFRGEIKILDIEAHVFRSRRTNDTVPV